MLNQRIPPTPTKSQSSTPRPIIPSPLPQAKPKLQTQPNSLFGIIQKCSSKTKRPISPPIHRNECKLHLLRIYNHRREK
ncbi:hypothetical protein NPIL_192511 [Nephila pilipes]|uniref:Uncharacterized protein n=1 Tax=Nephila pilipes TaxID=299642 RepID=A0A8X6PWU5_NEPPI|nr:hypothetical protein NPIL_192511 [Nephila pilipes]